MRALVACAALLAACGPSLIWSGRTADRRRTVEVIQDGGRQYVVVDGQRRAAYRGVAGWSIAFSERGGHLAYAAQVGERWRVVRDGVAGEPWDGIGELVMSRDGRLAYAAARAGAWRVVVDGLPGPPFGAILAGTLRFSADGRRVVYAGESARRIRVVTDGAPGPAFDGVGQLAISEDGARVAYAARRGSDAHVVVDGAIGPRWSAIGKLAVSPTGRVAYAGLERDGWRVVVDGAPGPVVDAVRHLLFRDDGRHLAWVARVGERDVLTLDGAPVAAWPALRTAAISFRPVAAGGTGAGLVHVSGHDGGQRVIIDGVESPTYTEVGNPIWSATGRLAYAAREGDRWVMIVDGRRLPGGTSVGDPVFSPDGERLAYLARPAPQRDRATTSVVVDGSHHWFPFALEGSLAFSSDSRRWAVIAGDLARKELYFAIGAAARAPRTVPLAAVELYSAVAQRAPESPLDLSASDNRLLQTWSRAEADRAGTP